MTRTEILAEAARIVTTDRSSAYGEPEDLFAAIAMIWDAIDIARGSRRRGACDVGLYMTGLKLARASANPDHGDSWVDGCGYLACGGEIATGGAAAASVAPAISPCCECDGSGIL